MTHPSSQFQLGTLQHSSPSEPDLSPISSRNNSRVDAVSAWLHIRHVTILGQSLFPGKGEEEGFLVSQAWVTFSYPEPRSGVSPAEHTDLFPGEGV